MQMITLEQIRTYASRVTLSLMFLVVSGLVFCQKAVCAGQNLCSVGSLPEDIQSRLKEEYGSWKVQEPVGLSKRARERWESPLRSPRPHFMRVLCSYWAVSQPRCGAVVALVSRSMAFANLPALARLIMSSIAVLVSGSRLAMVNRMFIRIIRRASSSATMVCSAGLGLAAFNKASRTHSLIVRSPARASNCAYSSSVTLVLMDLVRGVGIRQFLVLTEEKASGRELTPNKINKFPYENQGWMRANSSERKVASGRVCSKFPNSNFGCCAAPKTG
jgi:hypothetical protein